MPQIDKRLTPFVVKATEAGSVASSDAIQALSRQTNCLALRCCGEAIDRVFTDPDDAPVATIAATDTWYSFTIGDTSVTDDCTYTLPWRAGNGLDWLRLVVGLVSIHYVPILFRFTTSTLIDAVGTSTGIPNAAYFCWEQMSQDSWLNKDWGGWGGTARALGGSANCLIKSPTLPASREVLITPQVRINSGTSSASLLDQGGRYDIYLEWVQVRDEPDARVYG